MGCCLKFYTTPLTDHVFIYLVRCRSVLSRWLDGMHTRIPLILRHAPAKLAVRNVGWGSGAGLHFTWWLKLTKCFFLKAIILNALNELNVLHCCRTARSQELTARVAFSWSAAPPPLKEVSRRGFVAGGAGVWLRWLAWSVPLMNEMKALKGVCRFSDSKNVP